MRFNASYGADGGVRAMRTILSALFCALTLTAHAIAQNSNDAMTAGDLQDICTGSSPESKAACHFYILGITQGISLGASVADGKTKGGGPCVPENTSSLTLELAVKMKLGQDLMVYPEDKKLDASGMIGAILVHAYPCKKMH